MPYLWSGRGVWFTGYVQVFGGDKGRYYENFKRALADFNNCGPIIKTSMIDVYIVLDA